MKLNEYERSSALWQKIEAELEDRLDSLRCRNDGSLDVIETATVRGTIKAIKEILGWKEADPQIDA